MTQLWRYPVKSLGGERVDRVHAGPGRSLAGDRTWAVYNAIGGEIVTAKRDPRALFLWAHTSAAGDVRIELPDCEEALDVTQAGEAVSAWIGRQVTLIPWGSPNVRPSFDFGFELDATADSFADCGALVHMTTTATLRWVADRSDGSLSPDQATRRLRPNLVVDADEDPLAEQTWVGQTLRAGEVELEVTEGTTRCVMVDLAQPGIRGQDGLLDTLRGEHAGVLGVYATVRKGGLLREGQSVVFGGDGS